jgi:hypothetical protein
MAMMMTGKRRTLKYLQKFSRAFSTSNSLFETAEET